MQLNKSEKSEVDENVMLDPHLHLLSALKF